MHIWLLVAAAAAWGFGLHQDNEDVVMVGLLVLGASIVSSSQHSAPQFAGAK